MFTNVLEAFGTLLENYIKVLKINLETDTYEIIKINTTERSQIADGSLSSWLLNFAEDGNIYPEDVDYYKYNMRLSVFQNYFLDGNKSMTIKYRRKVDNQFRWVQTDLFRAKEFRSDNQIIFLMIRDINDSYTNELESQRKLEHFCNHDALTELKNFHSYRSFCESYNSSCNKNSVGIIFSDLNGLKVINDTQGHDAGNELLRNFSIMLSDLFSNTDIYRISGDEFLIIFIDITKDDMQKEANRLAECISKVEFPIASFGFAWQEAPSKIENVTKIAEANMYLDKQFFYKKFPEYSRDKTKTVYSDEFESAILKLADVYPTIGEINVSDDTYRILRMDSIIGEPIIVPSYTEYIKTFTDKFVHPVSIPLLQKVVGVANLKKDLEHQESLTLTFKTKDGSWRQITFQVLKRDSAEIKRVLFYAYELNKYVSDIFDDFYSQLFSPN